MKNNYLNPPHTVWCEGCGVEITWTPYIVNEQHYCCQDCYAGLGCECAVRLEMEDRPRGKPDSMESANLPNG